VDPSLRKRWLIVAAGAAALALAFIVYAVKIVRSLDTPEFGRSLLERVSAAAGTRVRAREVDVALLRGVTLRGVSVANPPPFSGDLVTADAFVLHYRLLPLFAGRLEMERLSLEKPDVTLATDARGVYNYERLGGRSKSSSPTATALPIELVFSKLTIDEGRIVLRDSRSAFVRIEGVDLDTSFRWARSSVEAKGKAKVAVLNLADSLFARSINAPIDTSKGIIALAPLRGTLAEGRIRGDAKLRLEKGFHFQVNLKVEGAQVRKILEEAKARQQVSGLLDVEAALEGSGSVRTLRGKGRAHVSDCRVAHAPLMTVLSTALRIPELAHPDFDECRAEFSLGGGRLEMPTVSMKGASVQLTGRGVTRLDNFAMDYDMTLALDQALLGRIPIRELRAGFEDRGDGFSAVAFKVTGTTTAPQTDLSARLARAAALETAGSELRKILKRQKIF
jgi:hypothetical protein